MSKIAIACRFGALCAALLLAAPGGGMPGPAVAGPLVGMATPPESVASRNGIDLDLGTERSEIREFFPAYRERRGRVSVMIVGRKTVAPRSTDTVAYARRYRQWSVAALVALRGAEDIHFTAKAKSLAQRLEDANAFASPPQVSPVTTGAGLLEALVEASRRGPIVNAAVYGHAAPDALYMLEDRGFYVTVRDVAKSSHLVTGDDDEKEAKLRDMGARDLADLKALIDSGAIRFAKNAVIVLTGCAVAGKTNIDPAGIAAQMADITGATTVASVDATDQSMLFGRDVLDVFYSRGMWVRFVKQSVPERMNTKRLDVFNHMNLDDDEIVTVPAAGVPVPAKPSWDKFHCAMRATPSDVALCGDHASSGDTIATLRRSPPP